MSKAKYRVSNAAHNELSEAYLNCITIGWLTEQPSGSFVADGGAASGYQSV
jgi:hypothetical protein